MIVDASRYFTQAKHLELYGIPYFFREWGKTIQSWTDLPLVPFLYGLIFRFFGECRPYIQIFTTSLFSMSVVLTYLIGRELWDEDRGITAGALLLGMPYLLSQVPLMLADVPTMCFFTLSVFTFIRGIKRGGLTIALSVLSLFMALFSKYSTWPMLSVLVVILLVYLREPACPAGRPAPGRREILSRGMMIIGPAIVLAAGAVLYKHHVFFEQMKLLLQFQKAGLGKWGESFLSTFLFQIHPFITLFALYSLYAAFKKRDLKYAIISWLLVLLVVFQVRRIRYTLPLFPMVALMASCGLHYIKDKDVRRFVVWCAVVSSLSVSLLGYLPFLQKVSTVNLKASGRFLDMMDGSKVEVFTLPVKEPVLNPAVAVPLLDLFTRKQIVYRYERTSPLSETERNSSLRFTWEYRNPEYYQDGNRGEDIPVVIISGGPYERLPGEVEKRIRGYRLVQEFDTYEGIFDFRTTVSVFQPPVNGGR